MRPQPRPTPSTAHLRRIDLDAADEVHAVQAKVRLRRLEWSTREIDVREARVDGADARGSGRVWREAAGSGCGMTGEGRGAEWGWDGWGGVGVGWGGGRPALGLSPTPSMMCLRLRPTLLGPLRVPKKILVETTRSSRVQSPFVTPIWMASPMMRSASPAAYVSALSKKLTPRLYAAFISSYAGFVVTWPHNDRTPCYTHNERTKTATGAATLHACDKPGA